MSEKTYINNANPAFIEELYKKYKKNSNLVDLSWAKFFEGFDYACNLGKDSAQSSFSSKELAVLKLINAYRARGHLVANTNPIRSRRDHRADLEIEYFGLGESDMDKVFDVASELKLPPCSLRQIIEHLQKTYTSSIGCEYRYVPNSEIRQWLYDRMEPSANQASFSKKEKKRIFTKLSQAVGFEKFLHIKYVGQKRFSMEGMEAAIPAIDQLFQQGARLGVKEFVMGMPHRGRLNVLANLFEKKYKWLLTEFEGAYLPDGVKGDGDVKYHLGQSADIVTKDGHKLHLSLAANPSHLEAVNPVLLGIARSKGELLYDNDFNKIVPILVHGDAAIAGQGIVYEIANMKDLDGYYTGGTIHIVFNNQVGFTANYYESRSSLYCTDIAKVMNSPVFHVNADDPEAVAYVCCLAIELRQKFNIDVYIDILGYRRYGHNEGDEPRFTQPLLYNAIAKHATVLDIYSEQLQENNDMTTREIKAITTSFDKKLQKDFEVVKGNGIKELHVDYFRRQWKGFRSAEEADFSTSENTATTKKDLDKIALALATIPKSFTTLPKIKKMLEQRLVNYKANKIDWGLAELLAYGSLLNEGYPVRVSGQDSRRGTFSHRHAVLIDSVNEATYIPLNHISKKQKKLQVYNSHLSEYGVLGYEYGYSLARPNSLTIWEAQFGDFANGAQIIIDQFISSAESKWQRMSGLVMLLPHGYEGMGPEHSSARLERFLSLCAEKNMLVANPTTPANFYHLLRRQMLVPYRVPLIVMTPKSLLRSPKCISKIEQLMNDKFCPTIDDEEVKTKAQAKKIKRLLICTGKIFYDLQEKKQQLKTSQVAIVRFEQLYPIPVDLDKKLYQKYKDAQWYWIQEEPRNMGSWFFIKSRLGRLKEGTIALARKKSASPANGSSAKEREYQNQIIEEAFKGL